MQKLETPNPCSFVDFRSWLEDLIRKNSEKNAWFSVRWLAKKSKWPPSLFSEVMSGKRAVTVGRALDLARFLKMSPIKMERLVLLSLATHDDVNVRRHFANEAARRRSNARREVITHSTPPGTYLGYAIQALLGFRGESLSQSEIMEALFTCGEYSKDDFTHVLAHLASAGEIVTTGDRYMLANGEGTPLSIVATQTSLEERIRVTEEIANSIVNAKRYVDSVAFGTKFQMKIMPMSQAEVSEVTERWNDLSDLIDGFGRSAKHADLYQVCFFAFPISVCNRSNPESRNE